MHCPRVRQIQLTFRVTVEVGGRLLRPRRTLPSLAPTHLRVTQTRNRAPHEYFSEFSHFCRGDAQPPLTHPKCAAGALVKVPLGKVKKCLSANLNFKKIFPKLSRRRRAFRECPNKTRGLLEMHCPRVRQIQLMFRETVEVGGRLLRPRRPPPSLAPYHDAALWSQTLSATSCVLHN